MTHFPHDFTNSRIFNMHPTAKRLLEIGLENGAETFTDIAKALDASDQLRDKPRPSDLVAQQPLGEAAELGRGRIARTASPSFR